MRKLLVLAMTLAACAGPAPSATAPTAAPSFAPEFAADAAGVPVERLVAIEHGYVAGRFNDSDILELVLIRESAAGPEVLNLGSTGETRAGDDVARISAYPVVCPADMGLVPTRFIVGEATGLEQLAVDGAVARGGTVVDDIYLFAFDANGAIPTEWAITDEAGQQIVTSDPVWFGEPPPEPRSGEPCSVIRR